MGLGDVFRDIGQGLNEKIAMDALGKDYRERMAAQERAQQMADLQERMGESSMESQALNRELAGKGEARAAELHPETLRRARLSGDQVAQALEIEKALAPLRQRGAELSNVGAETRNAIGEKELGAFDEDRDLRRRATEAGIGVSEAQAHRLRAEPEWRQEMIDARREGASRRDRDRLALRDYNEALSWKEEMEKQGRPVSDQDLQNRVLYETHQREVAVALSNGLPVPPLPPQLARDPVYNDQLADLVRRGGAGPSPEQQAADLEFARRMEAADRERSSPDRIRNILNSTPGFGG